MFENCFFVFWCFGLGEVLGQYLLYLGIDWDCQFVGMDQFEELFGLVGGIGYGYGVEVEQYGVVDEVKMGYGKFLRLGRCVCGI